MNGKHGQILLALAFLELIGGLGVSFLSGGQNSLLLLASVVFEVLVGSVLNFQMVNRALESGKSANIALLYLVATLVNCLAIASHVACEVLIAFHGKLALPAIGKSANRDTFRFFTYFLLAVIWIFPFMGTHVYTQTVGYLDTSTPPSWPFLLCLTGLFLLASASSLGTCWLCMWISESRTKVFLCPTYLYFLAVAYGCVLVLSTAIFFDFQNIGVYVCCTITALPAVLSGNFSLVKVMHRKLDAVDDANKVDLNEYGTFVEA